MIDSMLAVVIPFFDGTQFLPPLLKGIEAASGRLKRIYIIDNSSAPAAVPVRSNLIHIKIKPSVGFGRAANVGVCQALKDRIPWTVVLNQDTSPMPESIDRLIDAVGDESAVASPVEVDFQTRTVSHVFIKLYVRYAPGLVVDLMNDGALDPWYEISRLPGFCFAGRTELLRSFGPFEPAIRMYGEDSELALRLRQAGVSIRIVPHSRVAHHHSIAGDHIQQRNRILSWKAASKLTTSVVSGDPLPQVIVAAARVAWLRLSGKRPHYPLRDLLNDLRLAASGRYGTETPARALRQVQRDLGSSG